MALAIDPVTPSTLYAGLLNDGVYQSTDGGVTWTPGTGLLPPITVRSLAIDPSDPRTLYAGAIKACYDPANCGDGGMYKSTDAGRTWASSGLATNVGGVISIAITPTASRTLYATMGYADGAYKSTDAGATWNRINFPFANDTNIWLTIDPRTPADLYAATVDHGAWKSIDAGATWSSLGGPRAFGEIVIDPLRPHRLYAAAAGGGVFALDQSAGCTGDCDVNGTVSINEVVTLVNIALGYAEFSACGRGVSGGVAVDITLVIQAVNNALRDCGAQ